MYYRTVHHGIFIFHDLFIFCVVVSLEKSETEAKECLPPVLITIPCPPSSAIVWVEEWGPLKNKIAIIQEAIAWAGKWSFLSKPFLTGRSRLLSN